MWNIACIRAWNGLEWFCFHTRRNPDFDFLNWSKKPVINELKPQVHCKFQRVFHPCFFQSIHLMTRYPDGSDQKEHGFYQHHLGAGSRPKQVFIGTLWCECKACPCKVRNGSERIRCGVHGALKTGRSVSKWLSKMISTFKIHEKLNFKFYKLKIQNWLTFKCRK